MELGTSAKMLSIVPLMAGGGMYETGAGGSAPKHVQQLVQETTCAGIPWASSWRWPSPGRTGHQGKQLPGQASPRRSTPPPASLDNNKSPSAKTGELDNRGSQFYLALYWAQELAAQTEDGSVRPLRQTRQDPTENEAQIVAELKTVQGRPVDIGGYYKADSESARR